MQPTFVYHTHPPHLVNLFMPFTGKTTWPFIQIFVVGQNMRLIGSPGRSTTRWMSKPKESVMKRIIRWGPTLCHWGFQQRHSITLFFCFLWQDFFDLRIHSSESCRCGYYIMNNISFHGRQLCACKRCYGMLVSCATYSLLNFLKFSRSYLKKVEIHLK